MNLVLLILGTTAVTLVITITPFVLKIAPQLLNLNWAESFPWLQKYLYETSQPTTAISIDLPLQNHVIVCGYEKVGHNLVQQLENHDISYLVIDQSERVAQKLREKDIPYIYGNICSMQVLEKAGVDKAQAMAIAIPDAMSTRLCLKRSLEFAPDLDIVVKANRFKDIELLYQLGAREVVEPNFEASLELSNHLLVGMGISAKVIQKEI